MSNIFCGLILISFQIDLLGPALVRKEKINNEDIIKPVSMLPNVIELSYYSNTLVAHYALDSLVAVALSAVDTNSGYVQQEKLVQSCFDLSNILYYEFMFCKPCQDLEEKILDCVDNLIIKQQIFVLVSTSCLQMNLFCIVFMILE